jgi:hypothetical protein
MNSERNVGRVGMRLERVADLDRQLADPGDDRLKRGDERQHDLAGGLRLELAGASLGAASQPREQLARRLAARVAVALEKRRQPLLTETAGIDRCGYLRRNASAICESTLQNTLLAPGQKQPS